MSDAGSDTSPEAAAMQMSVYRRMDDAERFAAAVRLSRLQRELSESAIRAEYPEWSTADVRRALLRIAFYPDDLPRGFK
jgi:hypothetical protein